MRKYVQWGLIGLLVVWMLYVGGGKALWMEPFSVRMPAMHYGEMPTRLIGLLEVIGALALLVPRLRTASLLGLMFLMAGAIGSHWAAGHTFAHGAAANFSFVVLAIALFVDRPELFRVFFTASDSSGGLRHSGAGGV
ncbi:DoxX family protein [Pyxidicoccus parkwayensis]|uniref:DoxX family protein n=1 Tax=Pyxidicoccus parkwayensis TaxID=2813578 RepID=A0ABX7P4E8_9BACT|nr:DoxX family protein [Pyxidicoccus parkwaysis]QSQ25311.1 DoxX family protein [Pyxidicoccus parkwaysis]